MDPVIATIAVAALVVIVVLAYVHHRGMAGVQTDVANAKETVQSDIANLQQHVLEVKSQVTPPAAPPPAQPPSA